MKDHPKGFNVTDHRGIILFWACLATMLFIFPLSAFAHKVSIFAWVEGDTVHTQSKFSGGKKPKNARVEVFDASGNRLLEGHTDDGGEFSFKAPVEAEMKIVVSAGMGHQGVWFLKAADFETVLQDPAIDPGENSQESADARPSPVRAEISSPKDALPAVGTNEIRKIVEKALDKKLTPVIKMLSESRERTPSMGDIMGGIGYIIGLVGLAAYVGSRRKKDNSTP